MRIKGWSLLVLFLLVASLAFCPMVNQAAAGKILNVVGLYSETSAGSISYRTGTGNWIVCKVGDQIPLNAEITVTVDRDWIELSPSDNPNAAYEMTGANGAVTKRVADLLKEKPKIVSFPKVSVKDSKFANKVVVKQYLGRQIYQKRKGGDRIEIKY
ncbi:MAG TPA: hypothetical protein DDW65_14580, partial [Firmicutes bacterium]|nr:hypothetical protein [Bacillota bacterium]